MYGTIMYCLIPDDVLIVNFLSNPGYMLSNHI